MKKRISLLLAVCLLCFLLIGCGMAESAPSNGADANKEAGSEPQMSNLENDSIPTKSDEATSENTGETGSPPATSGTGSIPITKCNITLQNAMITDEYGSASDLAEWLGEERTAPEYLTYYNLGMIGFWSEEEQVWGYQTLWAYLLPPDAAITFHVSEEDKYFYLDGYTLEEVDEVIEGSKTWDAVGSGNYASGNLEAGDYTVTLDEIKEYIPEFDFLACCVGDNEWIEIVVYNT